MNPKVYSLNIAGSIDTEETLRQQVLHLTVQLKHTRAQLAERLNNRVEPFELLLSSRNDTGPALPNAIQEQLQASSSALKTSEDRFSSLLEALSEGAILINSQGEVIVSNGCAARILGINRNQLLNKDVYRAFRYLKENGTEFDMSSNPLLTTISTGISLRNIVMGVQKKDGSILWLSINSEPIYHNDNRTKPDSVVVLFTDITQLRLDRSKLLVNQKLLAQETERNLNAARAVAEAVVDAQEKERAEIGFELHDNVNQILSTARLFLDQALIDESDRLDLIRRSSKGLAQAVSELRKISRSLVPASLNDLGLIPSLEDLLESARVAQKIHVEFYHIGDLEQITDKRKLVLFRIAQEQVNNVLKHSGASTLVIELLIEDGLISLSVSDNGRGFDKDLVKIKKGVGLHNIASRAELCNGRLILITTPGNGCKLNVVIPV